MGASETCGICRGSGGDLPICSQAPSQLVHKICLSLMLECVQPGSNELSCPLCGKQCELFIKTLLELSSPIKKAALRASNRRKQSIDSLQPNNHKFA